MIFKYKLIQITSFKDEFDNMSLTLEGSVGDLEVIYAGAYTDRLTEQNVDYTDYLFVGQYFHIIFVIIM